MTPNKFLICKSRSKTERHSPPSPSYHAHTAKCECSFYNKRNYYLQIATWLSYKLTTARTCVHITSFITSLFSE